MNRWRRRPQPENAMQHHENPITMTQNHNNIQQDIEQTEELSMHQEEFQIKDDDDSTLATSSSSASSTSTTSDEEEDEFKPLRRLSKTRKIKITMKSKKKKQDSDDEDDEDIRDSVGTGSRRTRHVLRRNQPDSDGFVFCHVCRRRFLAKTLDQRLCTPCQHTLDQKDDPGRDATRKIRPIAELKREGLR